MVDERHSLLETDGIIPLDDDGESLVSIILALKRAFKVTQSDSRNSGTALNVRVFLLKRSGSDRKRMCELRQRC